MIWNNLPESRKWTATDRQGFTYIVEQVAPNDPYGGWRAMVEDPPSVLGSFSTFSDAKNQCRLVSHCRPVRPLPPEGQPMIAEERKVRAKGIRAGLAEVKQLVDKLADGTFDLNHDRKLELIWRLNDDFQDLDRRLEIIEESE